MVVVIGLGSFLISTLYIVETSLLGQVEFVGRENQSNTILMDIQPSQKEGVVKLTNELNLPIQQLVPIVTCRLSSIKGKTVSEFQSDTTDAVPNWALTREYRVSYRDSLTGSESLLEGRLHGIYGDSIFVTISNGMQENLELNLYDEVVFDVQGIPVTTYIGGIREVDWAQNPPNFIFIFPSGVLEEAPQFFVLATHIENQALADRYFREMFALYPTVSILDLKLMLRILDDFFDKISWVIRFLALFSMITGLIVLASAVINSKYARLMENVLLRTMGASGNQITGLTLIEYGYLGFFSGMAGTILSLISGWFLAEFLFEIIYNPVLPGLMIIWSTVIGLTVFIGWWNTRSVIRHSPLEILRKES